MLRKLLSALLFSVALASSATLSELLDAVQDIVTKYESDGTAVENPYLYTKVLEYYRYGKLYASYNLYEPAVEMLELAACSAAPVDCNPYRYFVSAVHPTNYYYLRRYYPVLAALVETSYNAYAQWWINKQLGKEEYTEYKHPEFILKEKFLPAWEAFLRVEKKPIYFLIHKELTMPDRFLLFLLRSSKRLGLIKKMVFYGDKGDYLYLLHNGLIDYSVVFKPYNCPYHDFIAVY